MNIFGKSDARKKNKIAAFCGVTTQVSDKGEGDIFGGGMVKSDRQRGSGGGGGLGQPIRHLPQEEGTDWTRNPSID